MVSGHDVYCAMTRGSCAARLSAEDLALLDEVFKERSRHHHARMKISTLARIYNISPFGLARRLGITSQRAAEERAKFLAMFPVMDRALRQVSAYGAIRGYAQLRTGLRRHRARGGRPTVNWLRNTPIQGSASAVFKVAGNRLRRRDQHYGARLILPLHDAFVFECPLAHLERVGRTTAEVMKGAVQIDALRQLRGSDRAGLDGLGTNVLTLSEERGHLFRCVKSRSGKSLLRRDYVSPDERIVSVRNAHREIARINPELLPDPDRQSDGRHRWNFRLLHPGRIGRREGTVSDIRPDRAGLGEGSYSPRASPTHQDQSRLVWYNKGVHSWNPTAVPSLRTPWKGDS